MPHKILLVDDEPDLIAMIQYNLERAGYTVAHARDGVEALALAEAEVPDLMVLDLMMPRMDGLETCRRFRGHPQLKAVPILMLTARGEEAYQIQGLDLGADDFVQKPISPQVLLSRIRALLRRAESAAPVGNVLRVHDLKIDRDRFAVFRGADERIRLPRKEFEILYLLATRPGTVISRQEMLDTIWGEDVFVTPRTVDVHVRKIRDKVGEAYIETVTGVGYRLKE